MQAAMDACMTVAAVCGGSVMGPKLFTNDPIDRPLWMSDEQWKIFQDMVKVARAQFAALLARDRETWLKLNLRAREISRVAHDKMFV